MNAYLTKEEIVEQLEKVTNEFSSFCQQIDEDRFFHQPPVKWSIAQNVTHLTTSANMTKLAYALPKFMVKIYTGRPNRASRNYLALVDRYKLKLEQGGQASGRFVAKPVPAKEGKDNVLNAFKKAMEKLCRTIAGKWQDPQLDQFLAPHPLLGKITLRELGYFTIYHIEHHLNIIKERLTEKTES